MTLTVDRPRTDALSAVQAQFGSGVVCSTPFAPRPPLWIEPADQELATSLPAALAWMEAHHDHMEAALLTFGAIVFRGFPIGCTDDFSDAMSRFKPFSAGYAGGTTDRKAIKGQVMYGDRAQSLGVTVWLMSKDLKAMVKEAKIGAEGKFEIKDVPAGDYVLVTEQKGSAKPLTGAVGVTVKEGPVATEQNIKLKQQ